MPFRTPEFNLSDELTTQEIAFIQALALLAGYNAANVQLVGGSGFTPLPAIGTVNSVNTAFTFTQKPTYIVSDGVWYPETDNNGNQQWAWDGVSTATMIIPPNNSIFGVA